ncbi:hypothetical protein GLYMA_19G023550v4 [Glycine max]|nr:hypothetical protein GLYMA_19G023550v4 [Glycine max]KAH1076081.1 hypothetical protein GYH30_051807 [Glycine max]
MILMVMRNLSSVKSLKSNAFQTQGVGITQREPVFGYLVFPPKQSEYTKAMVNYLSSQINVVVLFDFDGKIWW